MGSSHVPEPLPVPSASLLLQSDWAPLRLGKLGRTLLCLPPQRSSLWTIREHLDATSISGLHVRARSSLWMSFSKSFIVLEYLIMICRVCLAEEGSFASMSLLYMWAVLTTSLEFPIKSWTRLSTRVCSAWYRRISSLFYANSLVIAATCAANWASLVSNTSIFDHFVFFANSLRIFPGPQLFNALFTPQVMCSNRT